MDKAAKFINQSYSELQAQTGIDRAVWSRYFNGKQAPNLKRFRELAEVAGVPLWDLVDAFSDRRRKICEERDRASKKEVES